MRQVVTLAFLTALVSAGPAAAQMSASDVVVRLEQIEQQLRLLTGQIEQLQFRNQQLEQQLQRAQGAAAPQAQPQYPSQPPYQSQSAAPQQPGAPMQAAPAQRAAAPVSADPSPIRPVSPGRRSDAFDPNANPSAPGVPRPLGALPAGQPSTPPIAAEEPVGARGGREPGAPLDLSNARGGALPPAADPNAVASVAPPSQSPRDQYDLGAGAIERKDYALAEQAFRDFLRKYPSDRLAPDAQFWIGESFFQRQRYRDAADSFLTVSTKFETAPKAPDALLRLGQSLAALGEKETACATFAEIGRKYPRAAINVKRGVERELKRVQC